jgi:hypothetical protein
VNADFIKDALRRRHPPEAWIYAVEVPTKTGFPNRNNGGLGGMRVIDAFAMSLWPSEDYVRIAYEIKVDRSDWLRELQEPTKRAQAYYLADKFYFVFPDGFEWRGDIPSSAWECGVMEVDTDGTVNVVRGCRKGPAWPMPEGFTVSLLRCVRGQSWG